ncbi:protein of unknown function [Ruminococcaceae bacterium FB2012]|nr:protein of unknown function [Ruminococcaceae bacterium FB2012]
MITVYSLKSVPEDMEIVTLNDVFFNRFTSEKLDNKADEMISKIDNAEMVSKFMIKSRFDGSVLNIDKLSTGCKTVLNIMYNPEKIFDIRECGENALDAVYSLDSGNICCPYPLVSFDVRKVKVNDKNGVKEMGSYDELKEWWMNEN